MRPESGHHRRSRCGHFPCAKDFRGESAWRKEGVAENNLVLPARPGDRFQILGFRRAVLSGCQMYSYLRSTFLIGFVVARLRLSPNPEQLNKNGSHRPACERTATGATAAIPRTL